MVDIAVYRYRASPKDDEEWLSFYLIEHLMKQGYKGGMVRADTLEGFVNLLKQVGFATEHLKVELDIKRAGKYECFRSINAEGLRELISDEERDFKETLFGKLAGPIPDSDRSQWL